MKIIKQLKTGFVFAIVLCTHFSYAQNNQSLGTVGLTTISPSAGFSTAFTTEAFRFRSGLVTQLENQGTSLFGFTAADQWHSLGRVNGAAQTLTGLRCQRAGRGLLFGFDGPLQSGTTPTLGDPIIQWGGNNTLSVTPGDLLFRNFTSPTSAAPDQVLRLKENGKMVLGKLELASNYLAELDASNNTSISGGMFIDVKNITQSISPVGLLTNVSGSSSATGILASATGPSSSIGIQGSAFGIGSTIGVLGISNGTNFANSRWGVCGVSSSGSNFAGYFAGNLFASGSITSSDEKLKTTIEQETGLQKLMQLKPVSFYYNKTAITDFNMSESLQHGFLAQDMEKVFPEMVVEVKAPVFKTDSATGAYTVERTESFKGINYTSIISVLTKSVQEQQQMIESLSQKIDQLQTANKTAAASNNGYALSQNVPNPFTSNTIINYQLPANSSNAIMGVFDLTGKMLLQYNLAKAGNQINISGSTLAAGVYIYSLIVNGNEMISKKMVLTK